MVLERPIVLVVEDNKDIRDVLALFLLEKRLPYSRSFRW
jgi:CheY-like chemotaxis protein